MRQSVLKTCTGTETILSDHPFRPLQSSQSLQELIQAQTAMSRAGGSFGPVTGLPPAAACNYSVFKKIEEKVKEAKDSVEDKVRAEELKEKLKETSSFATDMVRADR